MEPGQVDGALPRLCGRVAEAGGWQVRHLANRADAVHVHILRDHVAELVWGYNEGRGLRPMKTSNQERANLEMARQLRACNSRHN